MDTCLFCRIVREELPAHVVRRDDRTIAFLDIAPSTRGHLLVIPRAHAVDVTDIPAEDLAACALAAQDLARRALDRLDAQGVNLIQSNRTAGWQQVFHFHLHVVPRYRGDALRSPWAPSSLDDATASELTALLA